jgi:hypothetical protein
MMILLLLFLQKQSLVLTVGRPYSGRFDSLQLHRNFRDWLRLIPLFWPLPRLSHVGTSNKSQLLPTRTGRTRVVQNGLVV